MGKRLMLLCWLALAGTALADPPPKPKTERDRIVEETNKIYDEVERLHNAGDYAGSVALGKKLIEMRVKRLGPWDPATADIYERVGVTETTRGQYDEAKKLLDQSLAIRKKALGESSDEVASSLHNLGKVEWARGQSTKALALYEAALALRNKHHPPGHPYVIGARKAIAQAYFELNRLDDAEKILVDLVAVESKGPEGITLAITLNSLAGIYETRGDFVKGLETYQRVLGIVERLQGKDHPDVGIVLSNLSNVYTVTARFDESLAIQERALAIKEKAFGPDHASIGFTLANMAVVYDSIGLMAKAEPLHARTVAIFRKAFGDKDANLGTAIQNMARGQMNLGRFAKAITLYQEAEAILTATVGPSSINMATLALNVGDNYKVMGDFARAREWYDKALAVYTSLGQRKRAEVAIVLEGLGAAAEQEGKLELAEERLREALAIQTETLGANNHATAFASANLAHFLNRRGRLDEAAKLLESARAVQGAIDGKHLRLVEYDLGLASVYLKLRRDAEALAVANRALGVAEQFVKHPVQALALNTLAAIAAEGGDIAKAVALRTRAADIRELSLGALLAVGSEAQKLKFFEPIARETQATVALNVQHAPRDPAATALALTTILRRKGRVLDAMSATLAAIRNRMSGDDKQLLEQLERTRAELSAWILRGPGTRPTSVAVYQERLDLLTKRLTGLEDKLGALAAQLPDEGRAVTIADVQRAVPPGAALVEIVSHRDLDARARSAADEQRTSRYIAYVLRGTGAPQLVDLGPGEAIDQQIAALRTVLADPARRDVARPARALHELVMKPMLPHLAGVTELYVAPDGMLNLVPFAAFQDPTGRFLVERYLITYLTTGRELLRKPRVTPRSAPFVIGAPEFAARAPERTIEFTPLAGTADEATALGRTLPRARVVLGTEATEGAIKAIAGPEILHIATHGFFLDDTAEVSQGTRGLVRVRDDKKAIPTQNPLLRSGLALAGANSVGSGDDDGLLTALEASSLDLRGTRLVSLSACETGVGEVHNGNGVFGLRRALVMAGAETQVMTLWRVDDAATRDLMVRYYAGLQRNRGRSEAMRAVQLEMLSSGRSHPFYWAGFIVSGDATSLDGKRATVPPVMRGARGCACDASAPPASWLVVVGVVAFALRRRRAASC